MRYINIENKTPPNDWYQKAERLTSELSCLRTPEERKKFISKSTNKIWTELRKWLAELSHEKCWYSEAREIFSLYDIDHFRPKSRTRNLDNNEREGYWWLAYDWRNYRLSGQVGNRRYQEGGKGDFFPLKKGSPVATGPNCDLCDEIIYLLDPTDPNDPILLTFDESGYPKPAVPEQTWEYERVKETIKLLHLDYQPLVDERKKIWNKCNLLIIEAENLMKDEIDVISVTKKTRLKNIFKDLKKMTSEEAELSTTAKACLLSCGNIWARSLVS